MQRQYRVLGIKNPWLKNPGLPNKPIRRVAESQ